MFTGDLTHTTDDPKERHKRLTEFRGIVSDLKVKNVKFIPGEHDASLDNGAIYKEIFGNTYYSYDHKGVHFVMLDNVSDPGANIGDGYAVFEATHGTAPKYADKDVINPGSLILSGCMMFEHLGWKDVAKTIENAFAKTIQQGKVTYDLERLMSGATKLKTSEFGRAIVENM